MKVLNTATCPRCRGKKTARGGYDKTRGGSLWKCRGCKHEFVVKTLVFVRPR